MSTLIGNQYMSTEPVYLGPSRDKQASRYEITCPCCGNQWEPPNTIFSSQIVDCPDCRAQSLADYRHYEVDLLAPGFPK